MASSREKRIVLFGSTGFVGSNIADALTDRNLCTPEWPKVDFTKPDTLQGVLQAGDIVVNAAGYANSTDTTPRGRALFQSVNVDGLRNLVQAASEAGAVQFVHISSVAAMGRLEGENVAENASGPITSPYAQSKLDGERILANAHTDVPITVLRPTSVFGEGRGLGATLCRLVRGRFVPLPSGGRTLIPFTYIGNIVQAVKLTLDNPACFRKTFIIGDQTSYSLRYIVQELGRAMGAEARILPVPHWLALAAAVGFERIAAVTGSPPLLDRFRLDTLTRSVSYSIRAFQDATGYVPPYSLKSAAESIAKGYLAQ